MSTCLPSKLAFPHFNWWSKARDGTVLVQQQVQTTPVHRILHLAYLTLTVANGLLLSAECYCGKHNVDYNYRIHGKSSCGGK